jgi:predicted dehydrogenase
MPAQRSKHMDNAIVRVGIIGAGANTRSRHIPGLQAIQGVEMVGVCNRTLDSSQRVAQEFGIPKIYANWQDVIADPDTNAVVIGTWPYLHCRATLAALAAGKHVLCEARMARNVREAREMLAAAQARPHLVAQIVPSPMTLRVDRTVRQRIADGYVGDVLAVEVRAGGEFLDPKAPLHWRQDFDLSGFNTMSLGIWYEAILRWVGEATRVTAMGKTYVTMRRDEGGTMKGVRVPEHLDVVASMACGAQAHFQISSVTGLLGAPEAWVFGSQGSLRFSQDRLYGGQRGDETLQEIAIAPELAGGWRVEEEFVNAIRGREPVTHTAFEDGVKYMEFTEAALRSVAVGRAIPLPLE